MVIVEYCLGNTDAGIRNRLRSAAVNDRATACLQRCGVCRDGPLLVVDGAPVEYADRGELLSAIDDLEDG